MYARGSLLRGLLLRGLLLRGLLLRGLLLPEAIASTCAPKVHQHIRVTCTDVTM